MSKSSQLPRMPHTIWRDGYLPQETSAERSTRRPATRSINFQTEERGDVFTGVSITDVFNKNARLVDAEADISATLGDTGLKFVLHWPGYQPICWISTTEILNTRKKLAYWVSCKLFAHDHDCHEPRSPYSLQLIYPEQVYLVELWTRCDDRDQVWYCELDIVNKLPLHSHLRGLGVYYV